MRIGISGHQDIPAEAIAFVRRGMTEIIAKIGDDLVGVSSLASGADQLFASIVLEYGGRLQVVIPSKRYERSFSSAHDRSQFQSLLERAETIEKLAYAEPSEDAFMAAGRRVADTSDLLLAIWDGQPAEGKGGTGDIVKYARNRGCRVEVIWPPGLKR